MSTGLLLSMLSKELQGVSGQAQPPRMGPGPSVSPRQALQSVGETCGDDGGAGWGGGGQGNSSRSSWEEVIITCFADGARKPRKKETATQGSSTVSVSEQA